MDCGGRKIGLQPAAPAGWSPNRSAAGAARAESPGRGVGGNTAGLRNASEGIASLVFGGAGGAPAHMPVLNGHSRANSMAGTHAEPLAAKPAGVPLSQQTNHRHRAERNLERRHKGTAPTVIAQYDAYLDACEDHTFAKLRANLNKMERKAEREHNFMKDAAGMSAEKRNTMADAKIDGRRDKSPARFAARDAMRMGDDNSVASLIKQVDSPNRYAASSGYSRPDSEATSLPMGGGYGTAPQQYQRAASPRPMSPRGGGGGGMQRASSPRLGRPASPHAHFKLGNDTDRSGMETDRSQWGSASHQSNPFGGPARASSPRRAASPRRASSPRPGQDGPRAQSPFRTRPE